MIKRDECLKRLRDAVRRSPVTALLGPRQCGKTTLARQFGSTRQTTYFDLESVPDRRRLGNPEMVLSGCKGLVVLDEVQWMPELFAVLRVLVDRPQSGTRYLVLGSASPLLIKGVSETLAGRIEFVEMAGFDLRETGSTYIDKLWLRGGFPRSFLAENDDDSWAWREGFIQTFLQRDIPQLGISLSAPLMHRFWTMLAHYHGQTWNASELSRSLGHSDKTIRSWLDVLSGAYMVRQLQPWFENVGKRQVKAPKIYLRDSGLLHSLLNSPTTHALLGHPRLGASWEGFALEQVLQVLRPQQYYFWATHGGAELDLLIMRDGKRYGLEMKFSEAPSATKSMRVAIDDLDLERLWIVYPGTDLYAIDEHISAWPLRDLAGLNDEF